jgi:hypothetical protein
MIYELRTYTLQPGTQGQYLKNSAEIGRKIRGDKYGKLEGFWSTEFGTLNQVVHLWAFESLNDRELARRAGEERRGPRICRTRGALLAREKSFPVLPLEAARRGRRVYELRWYRAHGQARRVAALHGASCPRAKYSKNVVFDRGGVAQRGRPSLGVQGSQRPAAVRGNSAGPGMADLSRRVRPALADRVIILNRRSLPMQTPRMTSKRGRSSRWATAAPSASP